MKAKYQNAFACPECKTILSCDFQEIDGEEIKTGRLSCATCNTSYPILNGIPRFAGQLPHIKHHTAASFGYKWEKFSDIDDFYKKNFLDELAPLDYQTFFKGKRVLDAGTGMGIPSHCMAELGAAEVFGIDIATSIEIAHHNNQKFDNVTVAQADIYKIPFPEASFDVVVCVAVLQHLPDYPRAVETLLSYVKPGGTLVLWAYGREGNGFVQLFVEPLRKRITRNIPVRLSLAISYPLGLLFQGLIKGIYAPLNRLGIRFFPLNDYMIYRTNFNQRMNTHMIFDQLLAPVSYLFTKEEMAQFMKHPSIAEYTLRHHNKNSWTAIATTHQASQPVSVSSASHSVPNE